MEKFDFVVADDNKKAFNLFFGFLFFLHFSIAAYVAVKRYADVGILMQLRFVILYLVFITLFYLFKKTKYAFAIDNSGLLFLYLTFWLSNEAYLPMLLMSVVVFAVKYLQTKKNEVIVSTELVIIKGLITTKKIFWQDIDNLIFKDNLLSVDLKSNKLFQFETVTNNVDEILFNQFCFKQLTSNKNY